MPGPRVRQHLERRQLRAGLERAVGALVPQLGPTSTPRASAVLGELGQVAAGGAGVGAEVEAGIGETGVQRRSIQSGHGR